MTPLPQNVWCPVDAKVTLWPVLHLLSSFGGSSDFLAPCPACLARLTSVGQLPSSTPAPNRGQTTTSSWAHASFVAPLLLADGRALALDWPLEQVRTWKFYEKIRCGDLRAISRSEAEKHERIRWDAKARVGGRAAQGDDRIPRKCCGLGAAFSSCLLYHHHFTACNVSSDALERRKAACVRCVVGQNVLLSHKLKGE